MDISLLPEKSGVYLFKSSRGQIIYIGKAVNIRDRVKTHLKNARFVAETASIDCIVTSNEPEALIKESDLIKKYQPRYNIMFRDDKQYFYVYLSSDRLPVLHITHQPPLLPQVVGPFTDGKSLKTVLRYLRKIFPYYTKKHRKLPCQYCHLNLCPGPNPNREEYKKNIVKIKAILNGKKPRVLSALKKEMERYSKDLAFEKAARARNQIRALRNIFSHKPQILMINNQSSPKPQFPNWSLSRCARPRTARGFGYWDFKTLEAYDISNIQGKEPVASMVRFDNGKPNKSMYRKFKIRLSEKPDDYAMMREVIDRRIAHQEWPYPDLFLIDGGRGQLNAALKTGIKGKVVALAKRFNELYVPRCKNPIPLDRLPKETKNLLMYARDEAHRFAISYHRKLHRQTFK